uniref:hypothetical protein n=1 Tax=Flavobacterium sp. TaxID=239 RepID=UPI0040499AF0
MKIKGFVLLCYVFLVCFSTQFLLAQNNYIEKNGVPFRKGNLWGFADQETKQILVEPIYDSVSSPIFSRTPSLVYKNGKCGVFYLAKPTDSLEILIPIKQDEIFKTFQGYFITKKDSGYQLLFSNGKPIFEEYFTSFFQEMYLVLRRANGQPDILFERNQVVCDSVFTINKIPTREDFYTIKRNILPQLKFDPKPVIDEPNDGKIYATADPPETHDDIYNLVFNNPAGEVFVLTQKSKKFIQIESVSFPFYQSEIPKNISIFTEESKQKPFKEINWSQDETLNKKVVKTENKVKFKLTNQYFKIFRLIQNPKNYGYGLIQNVTSNHHLALILNPIYKEIKLHQFPYDQEVMIELVLENGKKQLYYKNEILTTEPIDDFTLYFDRIITENNGLKGIGFLDFKTRKYTFIAPKYASILNISDSNNIDFKKVILPNGVFYYISKTGIEFYEP